VSLVAFQERRGSIRLKAASNRRSFVSNFGRLVWRRRIDSSWRSTRVSSSFARSPRSRSTTNSKTRQATRYRADTSIELIADTALQLFLARGFDAVTVAEVAQAAEVDAKTIYTTSRASPTSSTSASRPSRPTC
jgi:hypothetical protein